MSAHVGDSRTRRASSLKSSLRVALDAPASVGPKERILESAFWLAPRVTPSVAPVASLWSRARAPLPRSVD
ncbi:MAG: hypothetical protein JNL21_37040 [Myxococcales bacterium]|nr:hypothetical protein [Myxococcales bacterium]